MDTTEGDGAPGNQDKGPLSTPRESAKGPNSQPDKMDMSAKEAPPSTTLMNTLRFGSFGASSPHGRLWSHMVESEDPLELMLPLVLTEEDSTETVGPPAEQPLGTGTVSMEDSTLRTDDIPR